MSRSKKVVGMGLLAELAVVFVGVFVALAVDSWSEDQAARSRLEASLEALSSDLDRAEAEIDRAIAQDSTAAQRLSPIINALIENRGVDPDSIQAAGSLPIRLPVIPYGTLKFVVDSDELRLLSSTESRSILIEGLSLLERNDRINEQLAGEARAATATAIRVQFTAGAGWAADPEMLVALVLQGSRVGNMALLLGRSRVAVKDMQEAVASELVVLRGK